ncbi:MAG: hypothetical protein H0X40_16470 [Chthoniobacterales bacterium]|nr:hypothetical protein [Chthoniobacterales bacterium]
MTRWLFAITLSLAVLAMNHPGWGNVLPPARQMSCCVEMAGHAAADHCARHSAPDKPQTPQCCPACSLVIALLLPAASLLNFSPDNGQFFPLASYHRSARSDRPPVPPPRALPV